MFLTLFFCKSYLKGRPTRKGVIGQVTFMKLNFFNRRALLKHFPVKRPGRGMESWNMGQHHLNKHLKSSI